MPQISKNKKIVLFASVVLLFILCGAFLAFTSLQPAPPNVDFPHASPVKQPNTPSEIPTNEYLLVSVPETTIYSLPDQNSKVISRLKYATKLSFFAQNQYQDWWEIQTNNNEHGYIHKNNAIAIDESTTKWATYHLTIAKSCPLYFEPFPKTQPICQLAAGTSIIIINGCEQNKIAASKVLWFQVLIGDNLVGYLDASSIRWSDESYYGKDIYAKLSRNEKTFDNLYDQARADEFYLLKEHPEIASRNGPLLTIHFQNQTTKRFLDTRFNSGTSQGIRINLVAYYEKPGIYLIQNQGCDTIGYNGLDCRSGQVIDLCGPPAFSPSEQKFFAYFTYYTTLEKIQVFEWKNGQWVNVCTNSDNDLHGLEIIDKLEWNSSENEIVFGKPLFDSQHEIYILKSQDGKWQLAVKH